MSTSIAVKKAVKTNKRRGWWD